MLRSCAVLVRTPRAMGTGAYCEEEAAEGGEGGKKPEPVLYQHDLMSARQGHHLLPYSTLASLLFPC